MSKLERNPYNTPILYVDDEPIAHRVIKVFLDDWEVESAFSAEEALKILKSHDIMIAIVDIGLPGMDGISLLREMRKTHGMIQSIILTASTEIEDLIRAFEAGATDFLLKPVEKRDIRDAVEHIAAKISRWRATMKTLFLKNGSD